MCDPTLTGAGASQHERQEWCAAKGNAEKGVRLGAFLTSDLRKERE